MATINVSSTAALNTALKAAKAGDTILLSTGTYTLNTSGLTFASDVTIASANTGKPAVITSLAINDTMGLTLRDLELNASGSGVPNPFKIYRSQDVHLERLNVHGSLDGNPQNDVNGLLIRESREVSVTQSEFRDLGYGISHLNSNSVTIARNEFHQLQFDGVRGGGSSNVTIDGNLFRDFHPARGDHPDAIQFWTTNTDVIARNIVITNNAVIRGDGAAVQGIFLRDEEGDRPYENVVISGNVVAGSTYNGILVSHARDVTINDNVVQGFSGRKSWIRLEEVDTATVEDNSTSHLIIEASRNVTKTANAVIDLATDLGAWAFSRWNLGTGAEAEVEAYVDPRIIGDAAANRLAGTTRADTIFGRGGADSLSGGAGDDILRGGSGDDVLRGGGGGDRFVFETGGGRDRIADFGPGDTIDARKVVGGEMPVRFLVMDDSVIIDFGANDSIVLTNTTLSDLQSTEIGWVFG